MKYTKVGSTAVVAMAVLALAACGGSSSGGSSSGTKKMTLMVGVTGDPFYVSMECGAQEAAKAAGVELNVQGPKEFNPVQQNPMLDGVRAAKPDALLVAPNDVTASAKPLKNIQDDGTKVVLVDTIVKDEKIGVSRIASDNKKGGEKAAEALKELGLTKGKVMAISTDPGVSSVDARVEGFKAKAQELGFEVLETQYSHNEVSIANKVVAAALQANPDLVGVFATNLYTAQGVAKGVSNAKKNGAVKVVGFDAGPDQIKQLQAGEVDALIAQQPYEIGKQGIEQALAALDGKSVTQNIQTDATIVTKANMASPEVAKYLYKKEC
ncbi:MAG: Substrate-binding protein [Actinomycetota bacterium]|nr:Substrate-binding protein [Actinomycetota bacterium]